ncbi:hypothetical protein COO60DRAFT_1615298, partial [Scenedesmus sp. NREL 46B-D3]
VAARGSITRGNVIQASVVYAAVVADIFVTAYTDPLQTSEVLTHMLLLGLQIFLLFGTVLAFFLLTTSLSLHVHLGLYDRYLKQHGGVFTLCLLSVLLVGSIGAYRAVLVYRSIPYPGVWQQPGYQVLWFIQRLCLLALQCRAVHATAMAFKAPEQSWLMPAAAGKALGTAARG